MKTTTALRIAALAVLALNAGSDRASAADAPPTGVPIAWIRFTDGPEVYGGHAYVWVGRGPLRVQFDAVPQSGQALDVLWGSKNDERTAELRVNGVTVTAKAGGYDGFRWLRVPLPKGVTGSNVDLTISADQGRAAFVAEVRLTQVAGGAPSGDLKAAAYRARSLRAPWAARAAGGEAFPAMRSSWDAEPGTNVYGGLPAPSAGWLRQAERNGRLANEAFFRCRQFVTGWLAHADPATGLIPRNLTDSRDFWNGRDSAADNYPFMVLTASMTDSELLNGRMREMLRTETRLTSRVGRLTDDYSFSKQGYRRTALELEPIIFDSAEYVKDGLIPITEWMGPSPWSERMIGLMDDIWKYATVETPHGVLPTLNFEVGGDLLQACARLYWFTGDGKYLDWAIRLGDYYLLGGHHPTRDLDSLRLSDHGCEVVNGLTELYVAVSHARPAKKAAYARPLHELFERILQAGRNPDGLLYASFNPKTGEHAAALCDTWGYNYDGFYTMFLLDHTASYRDAVRQVLGNLHGKYDGAAWGDKSADGFADSIEGALNLFNREPVATADTWIDRQTRQMWAMQQPDGIIEGWHGDGNFARTSLMYALWKTAGLTVQPWRADVRFGAVQDGATLYVTLRADQPWEGRVVFDQARHRTRMHLPLDYPRINQFPEWFVVSVDASYDVRYLQRGVRESYSGRRLQRGLPVRLEPGKELWLTVAAGQEE